MQIFNLRLTKCKIMTQPTTGTFRNRELAGSEPICNVWYCTAAQASFPTTILSRVAAEWCQQNFN